MIYLIIFNFDGKVRQVSNSVHLQFLTSEERLSIFKIMKLDHIGIAVASIEDAEKVYEKILGHGCYLYESIPEQKVRAGFIKLGDQKIELLEPLDQDRADTEISGEKRTGYASYSLPGGRHSC